MATGQTARETLREGARRFGAMLRDSAYDPIDMLTLQHREVDELFEEFENLGEKAHKSREKIVATIVQKLRHHTELEEKIFYPAAKSLKPDLVQESLEEHAMVKDLLRKLERSKSSGNESYNAKVTVLKELVQHHVKEEESDLFPEVRSNCSDDDLEELGIKMHKRLQTLNSKKSGGKTRRARPLH